MFCKYCGKEIENGSIFCEYCGKKQENPDEIVEEKKSSETSLATGKIETVKNKKSKKPLVGGVFIFAIILSAAVLHFVPKFWESEDEDLANTNTVESKNTQEKTNNSSNTQYSMEEILQSDRWILGPLYEDNYMALEFYPDGTGVMETAYLYMETKEIPGWSSEKWDKISNEIYDFYYFVEKDQVILDLYDENDESFYIEMIVNFTLDGNDITNARMNVRGDANLILNNVPVYSDPDLQ